MKPSKPNNSKDNKLKSALRDNLKKRKNQTRRLKGNENGITMKLRTSEFAQDKS